MKVQLIAELARKCIDGGSWPARVIFSGDFRKAVRVALAAQCPRMKPRRLFPGKLKLSRRDFDRIVSRLIQTRSSSVPNRKLNRVEATALAMRHIKVGPKRRAA